MAAGLRLLDAHGDADMEGAISAANPKPGVLLCTALPALEELQVHAPLTRP